MRIEEHKALIEEKEKRLMMQSQAYIYTTLMPVSNYLES
jgi:hypothetical protein